MTVMIGISAWREIHVQTVISLFNATRAVTGDTDLRFQHNESLPRIPRCLSQAEGSVVKGAPAIVMNPQLAFDAGVEVAVHFGEAPQHVGRAADPRGQRSRRRP